MPILRVKRQSPIEMRPPSQRVTFLDGLRGWGALTVLAYHLLVEIYPPTPETGAALYRLAPFNGPLAVVIFFIVSGFSLSTGFLKTGDRSKLLQTLIGRYFRLAVPILAATLLVYCAARLGLLLYPGRAAASASLAGSVQFALFDVFFDNHNPVSTPIPQLWTMPYELAGSALVLATLWLARTTRWRHIAYALALALFVWTVPFLAAFVIGMIFAELSASRWDERMRRYGGWPFFLALIAAAALPGRGNLAYLTVATALTFGAIFSNAGRKILSSGFSQFLGEISFPLYLLHGIVIFSLGTWALGTATSGVARVAAYLSTFAAAIAVAWCCRWMDSLGIRTARLSGHYFAQRKPQTT